MAQEGIQEREIKVGSGDFELPRIYSENKKKVLRLLKDGHQELVEVSRWSSADDFMHFVVEKGFLEFADSTYPTPRIKTEVPIWFLVSVQLVLRLHNSAAYSDLNTLLKSGNVLSRVGYNVGKPIGFNDKNENPRETACDQDTVRKFFKDTKREDLRGWYGEDLQQWFLRNNAFETEGIFIIDQSHLVVPFNSNYTARLPKKLITRIDWDWYIKKFQNVFVFFLIFHLELIYYHYTEIVLEYS